MDSCESSSNLFSSILLRSSTRPEIECGGFYAVLKEYARREVNAILWVSLIAITAFLLSKLFKLFRLWIKASSIPGPPCDSFFGHASLFAGSSRSFIDHLSELHKKYGSVLKLWLGPTQLLVSVKDPALTKEMLLKAEDKLPFSGKAFHLAFGRSSLFFCPYNQAQQRRESLALELNEKLFGRGNAIHANVVDGIMERIDKSMGKGSIDCRLVSQHVAFTILGSTLFGEAFLTWSKAAFYEDLLMMIAKDAAFWASYRVTPFWKRGFWRYQSLCTKLKSLTQDIVQQCRKNCKLLCSMNRDFINEVSKRGIKNASGMLVSGSVLQDKLFLQELESHPESREESFVNIMGVMYHGCIAMAGLISSILERLVTNPDIQNKIYSEITGVTSGPKKDPPVDRMVLLLATIYESARLLPIGPMLQRCSLKDDLYLGNDVTIPAGAILVVPVQLLQKDNSSWGNDASIFNPFRFLTEIGKNCDLVQSTSSTDDAENVAQTTGSTFILNDPNDNAAYLPFGSGTRACVGRKFVVQGVAIFLASLLGRYEVRLQPETKQVPNSSTTEIVFKRRNH